MSKKTIAQIMLVSAAFTPALVTPAQAAIQPSAMLQTASKTMYTKTTVNVRAGASTKFKVVKSLKKGAKVTVTATKKGWSAEKKANVSWSKVTGGWVRSDLLNSKKPAATLSDTGGFAGEDFRVGIGYVSEDVAYAFGKTTAKVNIRNCSTQKIIGSLPKGTTVHGSIVWFQPDVIQSLWVNGKAVKGCVAAKYVSTGS